MNQHIIRIKSTQRDNILSVRWSPNNVCNFKCQYCFPDANAGTHKSPTDLNLVLQNFQHLFNYYKTNLNKNKFHLIISGGEPTLWPELGEFITLLKKTYDVYITIVSNGSRTTRWWKEYGHCIDDAVLSFHVSQGKIDHHIAVADTLYKFGKKVTVLVLMDPTMWERSVEAIEYMKRNSKYSWSIQSKEIVNYVSYNNDQKSFLSNENHRHQGIFWFIKNYKLIIDGTIRKSESTATLEDGSTFLATSDSYINKNQNHFLGWSCNLGVDSIYINWDGEIKGSCGQKIFNSKEIYNILDINFINSFNPALKPVKCTMLNCECSPETHITKSKI